MKKNQIISGLFACTFIIVTLFSQTVCAQDSEPIWRLRDTLNRLLKISVNTEIADNAVEWHPADVSIGNTCGSSERCPLTMQKAWEQLSVFYKDKLKEERGAKEVNDATFRLVLSRVEVIPLSFEPRKNKYWSYVFHFYTPDGRADYAAVFMGQEKIEIIMAQESE